MKKFVLGLLIFSAVVGWILFYPLHLQADGGVSSFAGVWHGKLDGVPGITLTLANDTEGLQGTVVMYAVDKQERQILFADICTVLHAEVNGKMLLLEMKHHGKSNKVFHLQVALGDGDTAQLKCTDCGPDSPTVEISKEKYLLP